MQDHYLYLAAVCLISGLIYLIVLLLFLCG